MGWPIYSECLVVSHNVATTVSYVVPNGKRAVVKDVTFVNIGGLGGWIYVTRSGRALFARSFLATDYFFHAEMAVPVYHLGVIAVQTLMTGWTVHVSGYVFDDPSNASGPPASAFAEPLTMDPPDGLGP